MTSSIVVAIIALLAVGEFLLFGALAETYRDIAQIRSETGVIDQLQPVDLGDGLDGRPSAFGLDPSLDTASKGLALFVDSRCGTCQLIVRSLNGGLPLGTSLILFAETERKGIQWFEDNGFDYEGLSDLPVTIATPGDPNPLGVDVTPLAVEVVHGKIARAFAVPSIRRFYALIPAPHQLQAPATRPEVLA
ncbi:hypothetical protein Gocc_1784 [Gaiella occulta]|uniref:Thioredoxin domain-containing protein n=1 Tax=Gaiella occulta TaxID=1002870 RepID=A0A7M2YY14_9ACTN|nr:hypothetical protein [Gaiella occulta]RDI74895.1 hypothetical protein Gocc_1784 [Gaiella occulta]